MARTQGLTLNQGNRGLLVLAIIAGLVAAVLIFIALSGDSDSGSAIPAPDADTVNAVVATRSIPAGTEVTEEMLRVVQVPRDLLVPGAFTSEQIAVGEVTRVGVLQGEQITPAKLGVAIETDGLAGVLARGQRGIAIEVREVTAVGGLLLPGDRVDVMASFTIDEPFEDGTRSRTVVLTVLQNVEVLSVAQESQRPVPGRTGEGDEAARDLTTSGLLPDDVDTVPNARTVTVAVSPADAQTIAGIQEVASRVWLSARAHGDEGIVELPSVNIDDLLGR